MKLVPLLLLPLLFLLGPINGSSRPDDVTNRLLRRIESASRQRKIWKRQDDSTGYLDQCSMLQFWDKQIGRVNVLAFFDASWRLSHRQASMLRILKERLERTGFDQVQFFAINASPEVSDLIDEEEILLEEKTWSEISPNESEDDDFGAELTPDVLVEILGPDVYFIQDTEDLQIWTKLRAFRDQILVIDRCGRLSYQVIVPWSILHFPYVKAAILSTYKDEPCGYCQFKADFHESDSYSLDPPTSQTSVSTPNPPTSPESDTSDPIVVDTTDATVGDIFKNDLEEFLGVTSTDDLQITDFPDSTSTLDNLEFTTDLAETTTQQIPTDINEIGDFSTERNARSDESKTTTAKGATNFLSDYTDDEILPIRIVMRAPHVDEYVDRSSRSHEYLVLKTGNPDYHGHLDDDEGASNSSDHDNIRIKARNFGKDESPGLYGEIADFWRIFGNDNVEESDTSAPGVEGDTEQTPKKIETSSESPTTLAPLIFDENDYDENSGEEPAFVSIGDELTNNNGSDVNFDQDKENVEAHKEDDDVVDEEAKSKLIAHYSKLLPYLYYVLKQ